jgi:hypothetical protein
MESILFKLYHAVKLLNECAFVSKTVQLTEARTVYNALNKVHKIVKLIPGHISEEDRMEMKELRILWNRISTDAAIHCSKSIQEDLFNITMALYHQTMYITIDVLRKYKQLVH